ncbi:MAG: ABC transporter [Caldibacillus debilis]|jgi:ABC-2 type transport system ATP-binding protein|uniref:ABC-type multidrug transport system, ATPase component n=2 Tax=Caldibacillus debilis TaxID=301148 RepID=A0A420VIH1_9BACI|nr:ABC transporter ATP-binding protein [Caldibacillus debilis]MBO2481077.1 ABC transporter [Bacillaceae bacterium]MBY6271952.1 ABC transporter [Bacillaceae bacterium]OUM90938.1 MAG: ABC transporter [Caldibacillus debilis]REJ20206.1 MAG: ABC transporter [Caldibacillus debilis]REJ22115.1 MAG: ABC transporter [Caldibacillus debilis]
MTMRVEFNGVSLRYNTFEALKQITLRLEGEKIYGLLGRNGAGKTSLLTLLAAYREPTEGTITVNGQIHFENEKIMPDIAFLYERDYKEESETVKEVLEMAERYRPAYDREYAEYLVRRFKLPLEKPVKKLSKGMQSAMNVTLGLASRTAITIFDEVYLGMDAPTREIFYRELLEDQTRHPRMFILSTHLVSEMDHLFDEVIILDKGKVVVQEAYDRLVSRGVTVTGDERIVDPFVEGKKILNEQRLGKTKSVTLYGAFTEEEMARARSEGLDVGPVSLQDLFIFLTGEED